MMKVIHSELAPKAVGPYSQAIVAGGFVFASGQLPIDPATGEFAEGGIKEQTRQSLTNVTHVLAEAGIDLSHFSNGNTQYPNAGVNTVGGRIGLVHTFGANAGTVMSGRRTTQRIKPHISYDIVLYGASKRKGVIKPDEAYLAPGSFGVLGFNFNPMYNFHQYFRAGASLDVQYDESANIKEYEADYNDQAEHRFYRPPFKEQLAVGLSVRGELVMPIFTINVGIGYNVYHKCTDTQGMYQILALKTSVTRNLFLHVGYQLSKFKDPNNLMLGIGYRFHNKR